MEIYNSEPTKSTPEIFFRPEKKTLYIKGQSYPENAFKFYSPLLDWVKTYLKDLTGKFTLELHIIYLNTSSSKIMLDLFDFLEEQSEAGKDVEVNWYYDPENSFALEYGQEFKEDLNIPFNVISEKTP